MPPKHHRVIATCQADKLVYILRSVPYLHSMDSWTQFGQPSTGARQMNCGDEDPVSMDPKFIAYLQGY